MPPQPKTNCVCGRLQEEMSAAKTSLRSLVAEKVVSQRNMPHVQRFLESGDDDAHRLHKGGPVPAALVRIRNGENRRARLVGAHISSPNGVETPLGCAAADRAFAVGPASLAAC